MEMAANSMNRLFDENADLFWGLRGGGNFGIVTSFEYQFHPVGPMLGGLLIYPMDQAVERYASVPAPPTHVVLYTLGGAVSRVGRNETAVAYRDARHALLLVGMWSDSAEDEKNIRWVREFWSAMQPFSSGGFYVNYETDTTQDLEPAYGEVPLF